LSFLDERDDSPRAPRPPRRPPPRGPHADPQTLLVRRAIAAGGGLLVLLLLFFGIRGCQASQKEQGFKDYVRDAEQLVAESEQQSLAFFDLLADPGSEVDFTNNVNGSKVQAEQLVDRADDIDVPDELKGAHESLLETLEFRRDGLDGIAREAASAGATDEDEDTDPNERIAAQMQYFLTSDVIYSQRFLPRLLGEIEEEDLDQDVPVPATLTDPETIAFLPEIEWLRPATVADNLGGIGAGTDEPAAPGLHGNGLGSVTATPAGTALVEGSTATLPASENVSFDIEIANQGEHPEESVVIVVEIAGSGDPIELEETLDAINPGETKVVNVPLAETPPIGEPVDITVRIEPVPGEEKTDNNEATFTAIFSR
jgi:hypothetical protein